MTEQTTKIERELQNIEQELYAASIEYRDLAKDAAEKRAIYDVAYAQEFLKVSTDGEKRTVPATESLTVQIVQRQLTACRIAEALADGSKRHLMTLQSLLSSIQTRASLIKTERSLGAYAP